MAVDECETDTLRTLRAGMYASADSAEEHGNATGFARGVHGSSGALFLHTLGNI